MAIISFRNERLKKYYASFTVNVTFPTVLSFVVQKPGGLNSVSLNILQQYNIDQPLTLAIKISMWNIHSLDYSFNRLIVIIVSITVYNYCDDQSCIHIFLH